MLPEFFTTGMAFREELADAALPPDGAATDLMTALARRHGATVGGSFVCRDPDGENRNAFLLVTPDGVVGRHDKDIPTMWENAFYVGGSDDGVIPRADHQVGVALCWELMRSGTARRLRGRVDLVCDGSGRTLAFRGADEGPGVVLAEISLGRVSPADEVPDTFWMHDRGPVAAAMWSYQRVHGRRWYRRHGRGRPPAEVPTPPPTALT